MVIKRSIQNVDQEWLITILRKMKMKRVYKNFSNPWCAFESAFAEPPFDVFDMHVGQVAMLYHTVKDHLKRHVPVLSSRSTGSLWDFVPEPLTPTESEINPANAAAQQEEETSTHAQSVGPCPSSARKKDAGTQWVEQMKKASDATMPFTHQVGNFIVALLAITLAIVASFGPTAADSSAPQLQ